MNMRRKLGKAVFGLALALPLVLGVQAQAQDNVSLRLNWYLGGLHVPFYYGVDRGFYRQEGINLTINEGRGSANTVQVVGAGTDTFGLADSSSIINLVSKGGEIKSVMNILSSTGFSVVSAASAGIRTPKDIEGKTLACAYSARASQFAGVSTPLHWTELDEDVRPEDFTLQSALARFGATGDLWNPVLQGPPADLHAVLDKLGRDE